MAIERFIVWDLLINSSVLDSKGYVARGRSLEGDTPSVSEGASSLGDVTYYRYITV
jgi:hypothetical protein